MIILKFVKFINEDANFRVVAEYCDCFRDIQASLLRLFFSMAIKMYSKVSQIGKVICQSVFVHMEKQKMDQFA